MEAPVELVASGSKVTLREKRTLKKAPVNQEATGSKMTLRKKRTPKKAPVEAVATESNVKKRKKTIPKEAPVEQGATGRKVIKRKKRTPYAEVLACDEEFHNWRERQPWYRRGQLCEYWDKTQYRLVRVKEVPGQEKILKKMPDEVRLRIAKSNKIWRLTLQKNLRDKGIFVEYTGRNTSLGVPGNGKYNEQSKQERLAILTYGGVKSKYAQHLEDNIKEFRKRRMRRAQKRREKKKAKKLAAAIKRAIQRTCKPACEFKNVQYYIHYNM